MTDVLEIRDLSISTVDGHELARCEELTASKGNIVGFVGPSGSGKTTLLRSIVGALPNGVPQADGSLRVLGKEALALSPGELRAFRQHRIGFVGQDPAARLNPRMRVHRMLAEAAGHKHPDVQQVLTDVGLPATTELMRRRAGELSGGQQRRVALARALIRQPELLLLDEPTAGLDTALREKLSELLRTQADRYGTTIVLACHDLSLIDKLANEVVDLDKSEQRASSRPRISQPAPSPSGPELLQVTGLSAWTDSRRKHPILRDIDLSLPSRSALGVVGASGAGKTTLARAIVGLHKPVQGKINLGDDQLPLRAERRRRAQRRRIQLVPQDPLGTLNPSRTIGDTLNRPLRLHQQVPTHDLPTKVAGLLEAVGLSTEFAKRYPHELSGGQRQRVAIARALAAKPDVLVCDEITASLDTPTAEDIMELLTELRSELDLALMMISHEIPLVAEHTSTILVLDEGRTVETGPTSEVLQTPNHQATASLNGSPQLLDDHQAG